MIFAFAMVAKQNMAIAQAVCKLLEFQILQFLEAEKTSLKILFMVNLGILIVLSGQDFCQKNLVIGLSKVKLNILGLAL